MNKFFRTYDLRNTMFWIVKYNLNNDNIYGAPKTGKTTLATQMDGSLLLAFEPGYHALPGVMAQDVTSWTEMKQVCRELKKPEVQATFKAVIVDTIDIAADRCKKYICQQNGIEDLGDLG